MKRSVAREKVFKIIFQIDFHEDFVDIYKRLVLEEELKGVQGQYAIDTIKGIYENLEDIDKMIENHLKGWTIDRLSKMAKAILRLGVYELIYSNEVPDVAAINEAVNLAHIYCDDKEPSFINGVLNKIYEEKKDK